jgi:O-antigen/teichoic acid export membrane protein
VPRLAGSWRHISTGVLDQAVSSATNFVATVMAARALSATNFGLFGLGYAGYVLALGTVRALTSEPLLVRFTTGRGAERGLSQALGATVVAASASAVVAVVAIPFFPSSAGMLGCLAVALPALLLCDTVRFCRFARRQPSEAMLIDVVWLLAQLPFLVLVAMRFTSPGPFLLAWAAGAVFASVVGLARLQTLPQLRGARSWFSSQWDLARRFLIAFLAQASSTQVITFVIAAASGAAAAGGYRGAMTFLGPAIVLFQGASPVGTVEGNALLDRGGDRFRALALQLSVIVTTLSAMLLAVTFVIPARLGTAVLGQTWPQAEPLLPWIALMYVAAGATYGPYVCLRSLQEAQAIMRLQLTTAVLTVGVAVATLPRRDPTTIVAATSLAQVIVVPLVWWAFMAATRKHLAERLPRAADALTMDG